MIYATADLHGCPLPDFQALLRRASFGRDDFLFVLGDVIDRGQHGVELLQWLSCQPNIQLLLGNHEAMLLSCDFLFQEVNQESLDRLDSEKLSLLSTWMVNGAAPTLDGLRALRRRDPEGLEALLDYLRDAPLYDCVRAGDRSYVLVHAGLGNFRPDRGLDDYSPEELLWTRPEPDTHYFDRATVVFGHTPTYHYGEQYRGRAVRTDSWICVDTGAALGGTPMLLRLDDGAEFY